jgi:hypothetical protein
MGDPILPTQEELNRLQKIEELSITLEDSFQSMAASLAKMAKNHKEISEDDLPANVALTKELVKSYNLLSKKAFDLVENTEKLNTGSIKSKDIQKQIEIIEREKVLNARKFNILKDRGVQFNQEELRIQSDSIQNSDTQIQQLQEQVAEAKKLEKTAGLTSKIFEGIKDIPFVNKLVDAEKVTEAIYINAKKTENSYKAFGAGASNIFGQMTKSLKDPLLQLTLMAAFYKKIFDLAKEHDEMLTKSGRQLVMNKEASNDLYKNYSNYASSVHDSFVTGKRLLESNLALNEALGTTVAFSEKSADAFARLSHFYGLSAEQAGKLEELGQEQDKDASFILNTTIKTAAQQKLQFGGAISYQNVLKKVSGVSGEILTKFKGNTAALVEAVMQADRLGLTLEQVDKIGESLLNFESSIESELKAELLTGKAINLEKARSAALSGDTAKLTEAIVEQVGNIHDFERMNVIQRKAYAEVFGMGVNEMGDMLRKKEFEAKLGDKVSASAEEQLKYATEHGITMSESIKQSLEQKSLAEEQKEIFDKLRDVIRKITSGPMLAFFHLIEKSLSGVLKLVEGFGALTGGALGTALGAALLGLPLALMSFKLLKGTILNPMITKDISMTRMGGGMGPVASNSITSSRGLTLTRAGGPSSVVTPGAGKGGFGAFSPKAMGVGLGLGVGGMALSSAAGGMEEGGAKDTVSVLGGAATGAGVGMMFGPWGAAIGAVVGGVGSLISVLNESEERKKQETASAKESEKKTTDLLNQLAVRPINLNVGGKTIMEYNTASDLFGTQNSSFK